MDAMVSRSGGRVIFRMDSPQRPSRSHRSGQAGTERFKPGDVVRQTGIYEVIHDRAHRSFHEVVMLAQDTFPACESCEERVRFRLVRTAPYIFQDEDFAEPQD